MQTTREVRRPPDNREAREAAAREDLAAQAAYVMHNSQPTPTQADMDAILSGKPRPRRSGLPAPSMPPLHEQHARIAGAAAPLYNTRHLVAAQPQTTAAPVGHAAAPDKPEPASPPDAASGRRERPESATDRRDK